MYKIIGTDGRLYGPVPPAQLQQWVAEGRANAQTLVQPAGSPDWKPLAEFPELTVPPLLSPPAFRSAPTPRVNGLGITSLVLGALGWLAICCGPVIWIAGIIFASIALSQIRQSAGTQTGRGLALAGLWVSIAGLLAVALWTLAVCSQSAWHFSQFSHHGRYW